MRASSSRWPRSSSEAFTAFGETGGALGAPSTRSHGSQPSCFLAYLRRGFVRRTKWVDPKTKKVLTSCTIITMAPNALLASIHDRMPVILPRESKARWLNEGLGLEEACALLSRIRLPR
ncbi:MAG: SOS response-associated peptidase family protein [Candidatus Omnitrophica bacterium]|nr:SOS response-associated peptidase family protein [Candidatus Omnitrophota bacterium]